MNKLDKSLGVAVSQELYDHARKLCIEEGFTISTLLRVGLNLALKKYGDDSNGKKA